MKNKLWICSFAILTALFGSNPSEARALKVGILVFDEVLSSDVTAPAEAFGIAFKYVAKNGGQRGEVHLISVEKHKTITTEEGLRIVADEVLAQAPKLDLLIVPSAYEEKMKTLLADKHLMQYLATTQVKWLASNCSGAFLLAAAGKLRGKKVTTYYGGAETLQKTFPDVKAQKEAHVVVDGHIITSNGSVVSYAAAIVAIDKLLGEKTARHVFNTLQMERITSWNVQKSLAISR